MKLLYLSAAGGGLDTNVRILAPALSQAGHQVHILYLHFPGENPELPADLPEGVASEKRAIGALHYYAHRLTLGLTSLPRLMRVWEHSRALGRFVRQLHGRVGLDLVEIPEVFVPAGSFGSVPYIVRLHASAWMYRKFVGDPIPFSDRFERAWEAQTLARAHGISAPSSFIANAVRQACRVTQPVHVLPYPVDTAQFCPDEKHPFPMVLFVGRVEKRKGADTLLQAIPQVLARFPTCEFVFIGRPSEDLAALMQAASPQVKFLGPQPHAELPKWYQKAWVCAVPSVWDNSPNTVYEAMACGVPVVATRVGGIPELVENNITGALVPPNDPAALAEALCNVLSNRTLRWEMGTASRVKAMSAFSVANITAATLRFYRNALTPA